MDLRGAPLQNKSPISRLAVLGVRASRGSIERECAAQAIILSPEKAEYIGERSIAPLQGDFCRLQPRGCARNVAEHRNSSCRLQGNSTAPGLGFQTHLPSPGQNLFDASRNVGEGKRLFVVAIFEIDSTVVKLDSFQVIYRRDGRGRPINTRRLARIRFCWRQPALQVPSPVVVAHQDQTGPRER